MENSQVGRGTALVSVREEIDRVDEALVELMGVRLALALRAAEEKRAQGMELRDLQREAEITRRASGMARGKGLDPEIVRDVFRRILALSHRAVGVEAHETRERAS